MDKYIVSEFARVNKPRPLGNRDLVEILADIKNGKYSGDVQFCRSAKDKTLMEFGKQQLPLFTPTGIFIYRSIAGLLSYNGFMCLDIDNIEDPEELKRKCKSILWVYAAFVTPSGKGLKVLVKTNATVDSYKEIELKVASKFAELTGAERDNHCKDIARVQYVSYDPELYLNENSEIFE